MDKIQKELIRLGRKDLAQEYYRKIAINKTSSIAGDLLKFYNMGQSDKEILSNMQSIIEKAYGFGNSINIMQKIEKVLKEMRKTKKQNFDKNEMRTLVVKYLGKKAK